MDIMVIIMGVIAVAAGVAGFIMEHSGDKEKEDTTKTGEKVE